MITEDKISRFIALLITETSSNKLDWSSTYIKDIDSLEGEQTLIGKCFTTNYKGKDLRLYKYNEPIQVDEFDYRIKLFIKLDFIENGNSVYSVPHYVRELYDLYETVQIKSSKIDDYLNEVLPDDILDF